MARSSGGSRHIHNSMLDYPSFLSRLNMLSSRSSVSSQASQVSPEQASNFESSSDHLKEKSAIGDWIRRNVDFIVKENPPNSRQVPTSTGRLREDSSVYLGCGGKAYIHWKLMSFFQAEREEEKAEFHRKNAKIAIEVTLSMLPAKAHRDSHEISFYMGSAGIHALAAVIYWAAGHLAKTEEHIHDVLSLLPASLHESAADEVLYGRAGYLFCLLFIKKHIPKEAVGRLGVEKTARQVWDAIIASGKRNSKTPHSANGILKYPFHDTDYYGAAHGVAGILYILLQFPDWCREPSNKHWIMETIDALISTQSPEGNFPTAGDSPDSSLLHWCHGAPGTVHMLYHAHKVLGQDKLILRSLEKALKVTWERGLLKKGFGLCHGMAGNGYAFLLMHRYTKADEYLYAAFKVAQAIQSDEMKKEVDVFVDRQRKKVGVPDFPYSLMEGLGGTICFFCDLLHPDVAAFPGYDGDIV